MLNDLFSFLGEDSEIGSANESFQLTEVDSTEILLDALEATFNTSEEYANFLNEAATEMELYGIGDAETIATEAKRIVSTITKQSELSKAERRMCIKIAARKNDPHFEKYQRYKKLFLEERDYLRNRYKSEAKKAVKEQLRNKSRKASTMSSPTGKNIVARIDKSLSTVNKDGRNGVAIKN